MFKSGISIALKGGNTWIKTLFIFLYWCTIGVLPAFCATTDSISTYSPYTKRSASLEDAIENLDNTYILSSNYTVYDSLPTFGSKKLGNTFSISTKNGTMYTINAENSSFDGFHIRSEETLNLSNIQLTNFQTSIINEGIVNTQKSIMSDVLNTGELILIDSIANNISNFGIMYIDNSGVNTLENNGNVNIVSVPLFINNISGNGRLNIDSANKSSSDITLNIPISQQTMTVQSNVNLITDINKLDIQNTINNLGQITLNSDGVNNNTIIGNGILNINSDITNNAYIDQHVINTRYNKTFTNTADGNVSVQNIMGSGVLQNDGYLNIFGTIESDVSGDGVLTFAGEGQQINNTSIHQSVINITDSVINNGYVTVDALTGHGVFTNNGIFDVHNSSDVVTDGNGTMRVFNGVVLSNNITQGKIVFNPDNVSNFKTIINISDISANSANYNGSRITATDMEINNAELQILISEHPDLEIGEQTDWLHIFDLDQDGSVTGNWTKVTTNNRYSICPDSIASGNFKVQYKQSAADVAKSVGATSEQMTIAELWDNIDTTAISSSALNIANRLYLLSQSATDEYNQVLSAITPNSSILPTYTSKRVNDIIFDHVSNHLLRAKNNYGYFNRNNRISVWGQGLYNNAQQYNKFSTDVSGITLGADVNLRSNVRLGGGYTHTVTSGNNKTYDMSANGNSIFAYGEYQLNNWRFDGMLGYNFSTINQQTSLVSAEYTTHSIGMNLIAEYQINSDFVGFGGTRYFTTFQHEYDDSIGQHIDTKVQNTLSLISGTKYSKLFRLSKFNFRPIVKFGLLYDVLSPENNINVNIANINYQIAGDDINPLGLDFGLQLEAGMKAWSFILGYDCEWHDGLNNNSASITVKYQF